MPDYRPFLLFDGTGSVLQTWDMVDNCIAPLGGSDRSRSLDYP